MTYGSTPENWGRAPVDSYREQIDAARERVMRRTSQNLGLSALDRALAGGSITRSGVIIVGGPSISIDASKIFNEPRVNESKERNA